MSRMSIRRAAVVLVSASAFPALVLACKKDPPPPTPEPAPVAVTPVDTAPVELAPIVDDGGADAAEAAAPHHTGGGMNTNQSHAKQCCNALRAQAKALGPSPEGSQIIALAGMCDGIAMQLGPTAGGQAPELAPLRAMLKGKTLPGICQSL